MTPLKTKKATTSAYKRTILCYYEEPNIDYQLKTLKPLEQFLEKDYFVQKQFIKNHSSIKHNGINQIKLIQKEHKIYIIDENCAIMHNRNQKRFFIKKTLKNAIVYDTLKKQVFNWKGTSPKIYFELLKYLKIDWITQSQQHEVNSLGILYRIGNIRILMNKIIQGKITNEETLYKMLIKKMKINIGYKPFKKYYHIIFHNNTLFHNTLKVIFYYHQYIKNIECFLEKINNLTKKTNLDISKNEDFDTIREYLKELYELDSPHQYNPKWSYNRLVEEHSKTSMQILDLKIKHKLIKKISFYSAETKKIFQKELPENTTLIADTIQLIREAQFNKHCLDSYQNHIKNKSYIVFTIYQDKKHINVGFYIERLKTSPISIELKFNQASGLRNKDEYRNPLVLSLCRKINSNPIIKKAIETEYLKKHKK